MRVRESTRSPWSGSSSTLVPAAAAADAGAGAEILALVRAAGPLCDGLASSGRLSTRALSFAEMIGPIASSTRPWCSRSTRRTWKSHLNPRAASCAVFSAARTWCSLACMDDLHPLFSLPISASETCVMPSRARERAPAWGEKFGKEGGDITSASETCVKPIMRTPARPSSIMAAGTPPMTSRLPAQETARLSVQRRRVRAMDALCLIAVIRVGPSSTPSSTVARPQILEALHGCNGLGFENQI